MNLNTRLNEKKWKKWKDLANAMYVSQNGIPRKSKLSLWEVECLFNSTHIYSNYFFYFFHTSLVRQVRVSYKCFLAKKRQSSQADSSRNTSQCIQKQPPGRQGLWQQQQVRQEECCAWAWRPDLLRAAEAGLMPTVTWTHRGGQIKDDRQPVTMGKKPFGEKGRLSLIKSHKD